MSDSIKLKPCPFCGSEAVLYRAGSICAVRCVSPSIHTSNPFRTEAEAAKDWNQHTPEPARLLTPADFEGNPDVDMYGRLFGWAESKYGHCGWVSVSPKAIPDPRGAMRYWTRRPTEQQMRETPWEEVQS